MKKWIVLFLCLCLVGCAGKSDTFQINGVTIPLPEGWHGEDAVIAPNDEDGMAVSFIITEEADAPINEPYYDDMLKDLAGEEAEVINVNGRHIGHSKKTDADQIDTYAFYIDGYFISATCYSDGECEEYIEQLEQILGEIHAEN